MKKAIIILLLLFLIACASTKEIELKSDGSLFLNGHAIELEELKEVSKSTELIIAVEQTVPYDRVVELMKQIKEFGFTKVGLKTSLN